MFSYYGGKGSLVKLYPRPLHSTIIEPFAGSARYSLMYFNNDIILIEKSKMICDIWNYLKQCSKKDIEKYPIPNVGEDIRQYQYLSDLEKIFFGFIIAVGSNVTRHKVSPFATNEVIRRKLHFISESLFKIKHWRIINDTYQNVENKDATWFIDPPYQYGGHSYMESNKKIDFAYLSEWCKTRNGQVIVCENTKAEWLPFQPLKGITGAIGLKTIEAIWTKNSDNQIKYKENNLFGL